MRQGWSPEAYHRREWLKGGGFEGGLKECVQNPESGLKIVSGTDLPGIERRLSRGCSCRGDRGDLLAANRDGLSVSGGELICEAVLHCEEVPRFVQNAPLLVPFGLDGATRTIS